MHPISMTSTHAPSSSRANISTDFAIVTCPRAAGDVSILCAERERALSGDETGDIPTSGVVWLCEALPSEGEGFVSPDRAPPSGILGRARCLLLC